METKLEVSRGPRGLRIHLPSGRTLDLRADEAGVKFIERMLRDADENAHYRRKERRGYIGDFPTQHVIDIWEREDNSKAELDRQLAEFNLNRELERKAARKAKWAELGVDLDNVEIKI